jgi:hypothetical protein
MEVVMVEPGKEARLAEIGSDLKSLQTAVGGYIEAAYFFDDPVALICNEEGKVYGMPYNRAVRDEAGRVQDIIAGPFFVCGLGEESFCSLPKELQTKYLDMFKYPEKFLTIGGKIVITQDKPRAAPARQEAER